MRENEFLDWIQASLPGRAGVPIGVGDDMAGVLLDPAGGAGLGNLALLKIDQALDRVHFDLREHSPGEAGRKAVNRCLSDCAAMACMPAAVLLSVALPREADGAFARALFAGCRGAAEVFDCPVVGGDTAVWDQRLVITVAALGRTDRPVVRRSGAKAGDAICVTGALGGSILGRHMTFVPRIREARALVEAVEVHAMMDLSDGLALDLPRLCGRSGVGAQVEAGRVPVHGDARILAGRDGRSALSHALGDGEDYELLLTVAEGDVEKLEARSKEQEGGLTRIGTVTAAGGLVLVDEGGQAGVWPVGGWEHGSGRP